MGIFLSAASAVACALLATTEAVIAGPSAVTPGPIAAVGVPSLLVLGGAFWAVRHFRGRK